MLRPRGIVLLVFTPLIFAAEWKPIDPTELALKSPRVEKDADAEALFWNIRVADEFNGGSGQTILRHYIRAKIFNDRGRAHATVDLLYFGKVHISEIAGRTIKPDGSTIDLKKDAIFDKMVVKAGGIKIKAKSFVLPNVEAGDLIEYRWRETRDNQLTHYARFPLQREIPIEVLTYSIKPLSEPGFSRSMNAKVFHATYSPFVRDRDGFSTATFLNMPAFHEEPYMPPDDEVRAWMLVFYSEQDMIDPQKFWTNYGRETFREFKGKEKLNEDIRRAAKEALGGASTEEEKLHKLFDYCRANIRNANNRNSEITQDDRRDMKENKSPADTLKQGIGTGYDINVLFAALATAAGFDARIAKLTDRSDAFFDASFPNAYFLRTYDIAVRVQDKWRFFDPASTYVPFGMLRWQEEGVKALIADPKEPEWATTPLSPAQKSLEKCTAKLRLDEDGTLEGDIHQEYTGHFATERKLQNQIRSDSEREQALIEGVQERLSTAELTNVRIENAIDPDKPYTISYHLRVPGYAQRTGKRLFLQPALFQRGMGPPFTSATRKHAIYFPFPSMEENHIEIQLPLGYVLDHPDAPPRIKIGNVLDYEVQAQIRNGDTLFYNRKFMFGGEGVLLYPVKAYSDLKKIFDALQEEDNHTITLKQDTAAAAK